MDAPTCSADSDCDDGAFCTGAERCELGACVVGSPPCTSGCNETSDRCEDCPDADGDGHRDAACGGDDCDDSDPNRSPSRAEVCDVANRDEDCDPRTFGFRDADMDGDADQACCNEDGGTLVCGVDCNDTQPNINPRASEVCDGRDNDCDGTVDEGVQRTFYPDTDSDGVADATGAPIEACDPPAGFAEETGDCDDMDPTVSPGLPERCDEPAEGAEPVDENCSGEANEDCDCTLGASRPCTAPGVCASGVELCDGGTWSATCSITPEPDIVCDGLDNDCDNVVDEGLQVTCYLDDDNDGHARSGAAPQLRCPVSGRPLVGGCPPGFTNRVPSASSNDCDDSRSTVNPEATEVCIEGAEVDRDDDCDGRVDEGVSTTCWVDADNDTYSPDVASTSRCIVGGRAEVGGCPFGFSNRRPMAGTTDCDDSVSGVSPAAAESCDPAGVDEDCDGVANPMATCRCLAGDDRACSEGGLFGVCATGRQSCVSGNWGACSIPPGTESSCNGADDDCDGTVDEGFTVTCYSDLDGDGYAPAGATTTQRCSCGAASRTTMRAPMGTDVDCDDADAGVSPGATELCDRIDNDCSAGGGVDVAEDVDGDGFARPGVSCTGGFPKTDCNDEDARVFPGQLEYFAAARCDGHQAVVSCGGTSRCGSCVLSNPPANFDFDCNSLVVTQPRASCSSMTAVCTSSTQCGPAGPTAAQSTTSCGVTVDWSDCRCPPAGIGMTIRTCESVTTDLFGNRLRRAVRCR